MAVSAAGSSFFGRPRFFFGVSSACGSAAASASSFLGRPRFFLGVSSAIVSSTGSAVSAAGCSNISFSSSERSSNRVLDVVTVFCLSIFLAFSWLAE